MIAQISDTAVFSAIVVYVLAMLGYATENAARTAQVTRPTGVRVAARAGGSPGDGRPSRSGDVEVDVDGGDSTRRTRLARTAGRVADRLAVLAVAVNLLGLVTRGLAAGRAPWGNMYEFAVATAVAAAASYLVLQRRQQIRMLGAWVMALSSLALGLAVTVLYTPAGALVPALNSYWLVIHVAAAITAGGMFTVGAVLAVLLLVRTRVEDRRDRRTRPEQDAPTGTPPHPVEPFPDGRDPVDRWPSVAVLASATKGIHVLAFPVWTFAVVAGAIWAEESWGRYWGWDPKETWAFVTWVLYAAYLHAQSTAGWRDRGSAWFAVAGYLAFLFNYFGVNLWITGLHSYAGV